MKLSFGQSQWVSPYQRNYRGFRTHHVPTRSFQRKSRNHLTRKQLPGQAGGIPARLKAVPLFAVFLMFVVGLVWAITHVPVPPPTPSTAIFLIDRTDPLEVRHLQLIAADVRERAAILPEGTTVRLVTIGAKYEKGPAQITELFSSVKLPDGTRADPIRDNRVLIVKTYEEKYIQPLTQAIKEAVSEAPEAGSSPLVQILYQITRGTKLHSVTYFGDGLENSTLCSAFRHKARPCTAELLAGSIYDELPLIGVPVAFRLVARDGQIALQEKAVAFWKSLVTAAGGRFTSKRLL